MNKYLQTTNENFELRTHNFQDRLCHKNKPVWISVFEPIPGYSLIASFVVYKAIEKVKKGCAPFSVNNIALNKHGEITNLQHAIDIAEAA